MVIGPGQYLVSHGLWLAQFPPLWAAKEMTPENRSRVFTALGAVALIGLIAVILLWLGARAMRRYSGWQPQSRESLARALGNPDDWASKPLYNEPSDEEHRAEEPPPPGSPE